jgi:hypothetical protein
VALALVAVTTGGCGMSPGYRQRITQLEADARAMGHPEVKYVEHMNPDRAVGFGFLPFGIAGFYVRRPGLAVSGILCWPLSIMWMPGVAEASAIEHNYIDLRDRVGRLLEESRAEAAASAPPTGPADVLETIERLHRDGKISAAERDQMRQRTLDRIVK